MSIEKCSEERSNAVIRCDKQFRNFSCRAKSLSGKCDWNGQSNGVLESYSIMNKADKVRTKFGINPETLMLFTSVH
jgi:hypothetical protein